MIVPQPIDAQWLAAHPLPAPDDAVDKNSRGRVLVVGGSMFVPGALRLTGEAALRAGAGKLQLATVAPVAMHLAVLMPEAAMIALPGNAEGEIDRTAAASLQEYVARCDTLVIGPGIGEKGELSPLLEALLPQLQPQSSLVLDAAAIAAAHSLQPAICQHEGPVVLTPNIDEMARFAEAEPEEIAANALPFAQRTADCLGAVVVLKSKTTVIACPNTRPLILDGDCVGLATSGSGDVLSGIIGGLLAQDTDGLTAAGWGVWTHNAIGRELSESMGHGFIASDLLRGIGRTLFGDR